MTLGPDKLAALHEAATAGPWYLCQHLISVEADVGCSCGYRGVVFGPEQDIAYAVLQPGHDPEPTGQEGTGPARYPRKVEIANAHLVAYLRNAVPDILALIAERDRLAARCERMEEAFTPSGHTKAAYIGEFHFFIEEQGDDAVCEVSRKIAVPWTTIKEIMAAIKSRAALKEEV